MLRQKTFIREIFENVQHKYCLKGFSLRFTEVEVIKIEKCMGLLKQLIEEPTTLVSFKRITKGVRMITVHPMLNSYANSAELDRRDLAYIITKTVLYFKNCL